MQPPPSRFQPSSLLPWLAVGVGGLLALRKISGFDTWWHLAAGRWIATNGRPPVVDSFSHTASGREWIDLQWLFDLGCYALHQLGGTALLIVVSAALALAAASLVVLNARPLHAPSTAAVVLLWALVMTHERFAVRPELLSYLWLGGLLWLLRRARASDGRGLWAVPLLLVLWANTHALFVVGLAIVMAALGAGWLGARPWIPAGWQAGSRWSDRGLRRLALTAALSLLAPLINPYGLRGALFPFELWSRIGGSSGAFRAIGEFQRPFESLLPDLAMGAYQIFVVVGAVAIGVAAVRNRRRGRFDLLGAMVFGGMAILSILAWRNVGLLAFGGTPFVITALGGGVEGLGGRPRKLALAVAFAAIATLGWGAVTNGFYRLARQGEEFGTGVIQSNVPEHAAAFARENALPPKLFNDISTGGYLTWRPAVDQGVFIDGRLEVYDAALFTEYQDALAEPAAFRVVTDRYDIATAMLSHRSKSRHRLIRALVAAPEWALVYFDEVTAIFVRSTTQPEATRRALGSFPDWARRTEARLQRPRARGRFPADLLLGVSSYASILESIGYGSQAAIWYERSLELGLSRRSEVAVRVGLAEHYVREGEAAKARAHLRRAAELDPADSRIRIRLDELRDR